MADQDWTPSLVEERLVEAADVLKRLPDDTRQGYFSTWPAVLLEFSDLVGQEPPRMKRPWPSPAAISRMEETLDWPKLLDPLDARILWLRAAGERWKTICWKVGLQRAAAHQHWLYGLCVLAWKLNGRHVPSRRSKRHVIEMVRGKSGNRGPSYPQLRS